MEVGLTELRSSAGTSSLQPWLTRWVNAITRTRPRPADWLCLALVGVAIGFWAQRIATSYDKWGLFRWIGLDWGFYFAQSLALRLDGPGAIYDLASLTAHQQALLPFTRDPAIPLAGGHVPYPPLFAWLLIP